jgi:hypothetical protein
MHELGRPLAHDLRTRLEAVFAADLSPVRIHLGPSAQAIGAAAFTVGDDIFFDPRRFDPRTPDGLRLLGHELTHVVQQRAGQLANPFGLGLAIIHDPRLEADAAQMGQLVASRIARGGRSGLIVQRMEEREGDGEGEKPWYEDFLDNRTDKGWRRQQPSEVQNQAWDLAKRAFLNMRALVISHDKDGPKGTMRPEDRTATDVYGIDCTDKEKVAAFATHVQNGVMRRLGDTWVGPRTETYLIYAANSKLDTAPPLPRVPRVPIHGTGMYEYPYNDPVGNNEPYLHAEIKVYLHARGSIGYIGVSKLCCLYCAAQLLAQGFTGFRGCSMVAFNNYRWASVIDDKAFASALWGSDVVDTLWSSSKELQTLFVHNISQGSTLLQKLIEDGWVHGGKQYSDVNQYPLDNYAWQ